MSRYLSKKIFKIIADITEEERSPAYVIGGYVRDSLLKRKSKDIDIVVAGSGIQVAQKVASAIGKTSVTVFENFGTAMLKYGDCEIEFVGARKESYRRNSRKPLIENGSLEEDQLRRDFTINAMAFSLNRNDFGALIDPFDGQKDLTEKIIRTPTNPDITFSDDPLRMLRAIRFASQLHFTIEEKTFSAIKDNVKGSGLFQKKE